MAFKVRASGGKRIEEKRRREGEEKSRYGMVWNLHKFGTSPWYGTTINLFLSKLCRKNLTRNVVDWYEMGVMVYFEFWWSWFWFGRKFP